MHQTISRRAGGQVQPDGRERMTSQFSESVTGGLHRCSLPKNSAARHQTQWPQCLTAMSTHFCSPTAILTQIFTVMLFQHSWTSSTYISIPSTLPLQCEMSSKWYQQCSTAISTHFCSPTAIMTQIFDTMLFQHSRTSSKWISTPRTLPLQGKFRRVASTMSNSNLTFFQGFNSTSQLTCNGLKLLN